MRGFIVRGCDFQRSPALDTAIPLHLGPLATSALPASSCDCIVMRNTLEHLFDPGEELRLCRRLLREGGILYLKVPNGAYEHGWRCRLLTRKPHVFIPPWHLNYFTPSTLHRLLLRNGFAVIDWLMERPTTDPRALWDAVQQTAFASVRALRALSFGKAFPTPLTLTCIARKLA